MPPSLVNKSVISTSASKIMIEEVFNWILEAEIISSTQDAVAYLIKVCVIWSLLKQDFLTALKESCYPISRR